MIKNKTVSFVPTLDLQLLSLFHYFSSFSEHRFDSTQWIPPGVSGLFVDLWPPHVCHEIQAARLIVHHVVPQPLGQLLVPLYGEVEAVVSEEGQVDLPVLLTETKNI